MDPNQNQNQFNPKDEYDERIERAKKEVRKNIRYGIFGAIVLLLFIFFANSFYIVREDEVATVRQFGEITRIVVDETNMEAQLQNDLDSRFKDVIIDTQKGLKFKIPFITSVEKNTSKLLTYFSSTANINTQDKIKYDINMYAQWRITHPGIFRTSLGTVTKANSKIDEITYAVVIDRINRLSSSDFLANKDALFEILESARQELNVNLANQGIMLVDIDVYRTILPPSNIASTYEKMIEERAAIAQQIRSEGLEFYQNTVADTDRTVAEINAGAIQETETIKGLADAEALEIYAKGFSQDPEFYEFWRTLRSYENVIDSSTVVYLDRNNSYLKFFSGDR